MTENKELTKEMIFERLGFKQTSSIPRGGGFESPAFGWRYPDGSVSMYLPGDPLHNLNATFKYVWSVIRDDRSIREVDKRRMLWDAWKTENPALAICEAFMKLDESPDDTLVDMGLGKPTGPIKEKP